MGYTQTDLLFTSLPTYSRSLMVNLLRPPSVSVPSSRFGTVTGLWSEQSPYDRRALNTGIVHFGPGRFFRGHLAYIIHNYLAQKGSQEQRWGICGVSLKSQGTITRLKPQRFLYTLTNTKLWSEVVEY
jgi:hypothetical protein